MVHWFAGLFSRNKATTVFNNNSINITSTVTITIFVTKRKTVDAIEVSSIVFLIFFSSLPACDLVQKFKTEKGHTSYHDNIFSHDNTALHRPLHTCT